MNAYAPPETELRATRGNAVSLRRRLALLPVFVVGGLATSVIAFLACRLIPMASGAPPLPALSVVGAAVLAAIGGAAPWWIVLARVYRKHALWAGLLVGALPAILRVWSLQRWPSGTFSQITTLIDTAGVTLAFGLGAAAFARGAVSNPSRGPASQRGAA